VPNAVAQPQAQQGAVLKPVCHGARFEAPWIGNDKRIEVVGRHRWQRSITVSK
jgi:hypothetical protein